MSLDSADDVKYLVSRWILMTVGASISAFSVSLFFVPADLVPSGISGLAVIGNEVFGIAIGLIIFLGNIPIQLLGLKMLDGWKSVAFTVYTVIVFSVAVEFWPLVLPDLGVSNDTLLNALFGGIANGVGAGLVYRAGGTVGGTSTLAMIARRKYGMSLGTASMFTDTLILILAGVVFGWEAALYSTVAVFLNRFVSDYVVEGSSDTNTAIVITDKTDTVINAVNEHMEHNLTYWKGRGSFDDGHEHSVMMIAISRSEIHELRKTIRNVAPNAFMTILQGQITFGDEFKTLESSMPLMLDEADA